MSDSTKAQKLAAARKKLKEFQQKAKSAPKKETAQSVASSISDTVEPEKAENLTNSTHSSLTDQVDFINRQENEFIPKESFVSESDKHLDAADPDVGVQTSFKLETQQESSSNLPIHNYFGNVGFDSAYNNRSNFFDNFTNNSGNSKEVSGINNSDLNSNLFNTAVYLDNKLYSSSNFADNNKDDILTDESSSKEIYDNMYKSSVTREDAKEINNYIEMLDQIQSDTETKYFENNDDQQDTDMLDQISHMKQEDIVKEEVKSPHESLLQLSNQIQQLIEPEFDVSLPITDLESRNQHLAGLLNQETIKNEQLNAQLQISHDRIAYLENQLEQLKIQQENRISCEIGPLQEQLQNHIQTVGILVAEKTELSALLTQAQTNLNQKNGECEELHARLKTSRSRVADLEKEVGSLKSERNSFDKLDLENKKSHNNLKTECEKLRELNEELSQDLSELRTKLNGNMKENESLQAKVQELSSQLSLANIRIQQLTAGENIQIDNQVETLIQEKLALEKQVVELNQSLKTVAKERDQSNSQYQQYVQQLNGQLTNLASRLETVTKENEVLAAREQNLIRHIGELEKHLQNLQSERVTAVTSRNNNNNNNGEVKELEDALQRLQMEKINAEENFTRVSNERDMLLKDLDAKKESISELEILVERLQGSQPDNSKLLATIESDKIAASRAVAQNAELKKQLQEMQDDFIKLTNDKLELTELLTREQSRNKEMNSNLEEIKAQLKMLTDAVDIKDNELTNMRHNYEELNKQVLQQGQLTDRLRHYEAQNNSSHALQAELQQSKQFIMFLTSENVKLKDQLANLGHKLENSEVSKAKVDKTDDKSDVNSEEKSNENEEKSESDNKQTVSANNNVEKSKSENCIDQESAMRFLEEKFLKTMQNIANLTEEKQQLEHLVLQLQSETETIGEYIALYQHQRGILKQRALEKDEQLKQLARDREQLKNKLEQLNLLIKKLVLEKGGLTPEILKHHEDLNKQSHEFCEEHAKMHLEISKNVGESENKLAQLNGVDLENVEVKDETAEKIIELLSEIKTSNLVQPSENFHPCPWCSGQLITV